MPSPQRICDVCQTILWKDLPPEDAEAHLHHLSRQALEVSAKTCSICNLILRAAISNYRNSRGVREGKGYWQQHNCIHYKDETGTIEQTMVVKNLGACVPVEDTVPNLSRSRTVISIVPIKELATEAPNYRGGQSIILPTGSVDLTHKCLPVDALPEEEELKLEASTATMPVWVYGNWWCHCEATKKGLRLDAHLMGIGARFGLTARAKDAVNQEPGTVQLRGSCIRLCTNDNIAVCGSKVDML